MTIKVDLPRLHMAGSHAHHNAHLEVGQHGIALFLSPNAELPVLDVDGTSEQLDELVHELQAALEMTRVSNPDPRDATQMNLLLPTREIPASKRIDAQKSDVQAVIQRRVEETARDARE